MLVVHATTVAIGGKAVLLRGPPGSGKSDLALRLLETAGAGLIADDQTALSIRRNRVWAACPAALKGRIEVRGLGIVDVRPHASRPLALVADLTPNLEIERMPDEEALRTKLLGITVPRLTLDPFQASAAARIHAAIRHFSGKKS